MEKLSKEKLQTIFAQVRQENEWDNLCIFPWNDCISLVFSDEYKQFFLFVLDNESKDEDNVELTVASFSTSYYITYNIPVNELLMYYRGSEKGFFVKKYIDDYISKQL